MGKIRSDWGETAKLCWFVWGKGILQRSQFFRRPFVLCPIRQTAGHPQRGFYPRMNKEDWIGMFGRKIAGKAHAADWFILSLAYLNKRSSETEVGFQTTFFLFDGQLCAEHFQTVFHRLEGFFTGRRFDAADDHLRAQEPAFGRFHSLAMAASAAGCSVAGSRPRRQRQASSR